MATAEETGTAATVRSVGVIGLGRMGLPISLRLQAAGLRVIGHDVDPEAVRRAVTAGVETAPDPRSLAAATECSLVVVGFDEQVREVVTHPHAGLLSGADPGHVVMIGATVSPELSPELQRVTRSVGVDVIDACLCRGESPAATGELLVLTGGDPATCALVAPVLRAIATDVHHLGAVGAGQVGKMINNYLLWLGVVGDYEALRLGARLGVQPDLLRQALLASSGANWALETWQRARPMPWAEEDMAIVATAAATRGLDMPAARVVGEEIARIKREKAQLPGTGVRSSMAELIRFIEGEGNRDGHEIAG